MKTFSPDEVIATQNEQIARLTELVKALTGPKETKHITAQSVSNLDYDLRALAEGRAVIDNCFPEPKRKTELAADEIRKGDPTIKDRIAEIVDGRLKVVD